MTDPAIAVDDGRLLDATARIEWAREPLPRLALQDDRLMAELTELWPLLRDAVRRTGPGCLWPGSLRWDADEGWQILSVLPHHAGEPPLPETPGSRDADAWAVVASLVEAVIGRPPRDLADGLLLLDLHAGTVPLGLDAIVHGLLAGGLAEASRIQALLIEPVDGTVVARAAAETAVGSAKAGYLPGRDNEDSFAVVESDGVLTLIVCDGVTGPGDGSGARASRAAVAELTDLLADGQEPAFALAVADQAVRAGTGTSTALLATVHLDGRAELFGIGDSSAWVVRPKKRGGRVVFRLTPEHTRLAESRRTDPLATEGGSHLVRSLGGRETEPFHGSVRVRPGDLLVLMSDGAAVTGDRWFGADLADLADLHPTAPALAAALTVRAELLGGRDNATAVIAEIHS